jgi:DNA polymerase III epsilon subunit-like protein
MTDLAFIDVETTGFSPKRHEVIDIWAVRTTPDLEPVAEEGGLVLPLHIEQADPRALAVAGFNSARWAKEAKPFAEMWPLVELVVRGAVLVGHSISFDVRMIGGELRRAPWLLGLPVHVPICTCKVARKLLPKAPDHKLDSLCTRLGVEVEDDAHTARGDVYRTLGLYRKLRGLAG